LNTFGPAAIYAIILGWMAFTTILMASVLLGR
jgi:hypothetical protein